MTTHRRDFLRTILTGVAGLTITHPAFGQGTEPITATKLTPTLAVLTGNGGNVALVIGSRELMLVDTGLPDRAADLLKSVASVEAHPITRAFNTHWHYDHVGANESLAKAGATLMAHENTRKHMGSKVYMEPLKTTVEPVPAQALPKETFSTRGKLTFGKEPIEYVPVPPAHTNGDAYVLFRDANVLHTGDLLFNGFYPFIDYSTGGWIGGMVAALDDMHKACDANTRVIPGHGPAGTRAELAASRDLLARAHERLEAFAKKGAGVDEVVKAAPFKDTDEQWGKGFMTPESFVRIAYTGLLRHRGLR